MAKRIPYIPNRVIDTNGISDGATIDVFQTGTTTRVSIYSDEALTTPLANPYTVVAGAAVPAIYHGETANIRVRVKQSDGTTISDDDPFEAPVTDVALASPDAGKGAALVGFKRSGSDTIDDTVRDWLEDRIPYASEFTSIKAAVERDTGISHVLDIPIGTYALTAQASITAYSLISGHGDMSQVTVPAITTGIAFTSHTGVFDDHPHNVLRDFRITGDGTFAAYPGDQNGTSKGVSFAEVDNIGSLGNAEGMVFELHDTGRHIKRSYGHTGRRNYYRANKVGLKLENVTSFTEYDIYARYNSAAAVQIIGGQNVSFCGGAIEGNPGKALEYVDDGSSTWGQLNINDVYFETNGDRDGGVPSIDVPFNANVMVNITGGNYWLNTASGITSGPYRLGPSLSLDGATINGSFYAKEVTGFRNCRGPGLGVWNTMATEALARTYGLTAPAIFHEFKPAAYEHTFTSGNTSGLIIGTKVMGRGPQTVPTTPNIANLTYPFGLGGPATVTENTGLDYGDGSFANIAFAASVGNFSSNYSTLCSFPDSTKPFRTFCMLIRPDADAELGFVMSVGGQSITGYYKLLANTTYRVVFTAQAPMTAGGSVLRMFPLDATAPAVNVLPIWQGQCDTYIEQLKHIEMLVEGAL